ncbi:MAG: fumarylacetoacetate hydrolase family protein [Bacteroidota bacterium]
MRLYKHEEAAILEKDGEWYRRSDMDWDQLINRKGLYTFLDADVRNWEVLGEKPKLGKEPPIGGQEVWAAGVTYLRSKQERMREAEEAGGGDFYDRVYEAERPEIFFKATAARTVGSGDVVNIRRDSTWDVPEPELTLFCNSHGSIEGYTIGNDMSSRSIEGENPLYLPQAKTYERCAGLGPCIYIIENPISPDTQIQMEILRGGESRYKDQVKISMMKRTHTELVGYLFRECNFPRGCFLMTGTCLVPDESFTLKEGDMIHIRIDGIGELVNKVGTRS